MSLATGNSNTGPEDIDRPFKRRRNLGRKSGGEVTRADAVAQILARANTVRELGDLAISIGSPPALVYSILNSPVRNSIKVMRLHSTARHFWKKRQEEEAERRKRRFPPGLSKQVFRLRKSHSEPPDGG